MLRAWWSLTGSSCSSADNCKNTAQRPSPTQQTRKKARRQQRKKEKQGSAQHIDKSGRNGQHPREEGAWARLASVSTARKARPTPNGPPPPSLRPHLGAAPLGDSLRRKMATQRCCTGRSQATALPNSSRWPPPVAPPTGLAAPLDAPAGGGDRCSGGG